MSDVTTDRRSSLVFECLILESRCSLSIFYASPIVLLHYFSLMIHCVLNDVASQTSEEHRDYSKPFSGLFLSTLAFLI